MTEKKAVFFCSASPDIDPKYNQAAREVVRAACLSGYTIVSGGSFRGTMGAVCDTALACGAPCVGVLPRFMKGLEYPGMTRLDWTDTMAERKELMRAGTSMAVALPGGIGTIDELVETLVLRKLGQYDGRILALDLDGFFAPLKALLDHFVRQGMLEPRDRALIEFPATVAELAACFEA